MEKSVIYHLKSGWNWPSSCGEVDFYISSICFRYFVIKGCNSSIWTNLNPLSPLPTAAFSRVYMYLYFWCRKFLNFFISFFVIFLSGRESVTVHLSIIASTSPKDAMRQVWLKFAQQFWIFFLYFSSMYLGYCVLTSPWKRALSFFLSK